MMWKQMDSFNGVRQTKAHTIEVLLDISVRPIQSLVSGSLHSHATKFQCYMVAGYIKQHCPTFISVLLSNKPIINYHQKANFVCLVNQPWCVVPRNRKRHRGLLVTLENNFIWFTPICILRWSKGEVLLLRVNAVISELD